MKKYKIISNAKINLGLNILEKLENNYHTIDSLFLPISLADEIEITLFENQQENSNNFSILCNNKNIPTDKNNLIFKIYKAFYDKTKLTPQSMEVFIKKNIPVEAGLGGGSSNAAFFLKFLNELHNNILNFQELIKLAISIGSDIPFFLFNKAARINGIGEKIDLIEDFKKSYNIVVVKPKNINISTKLAYEIFDKTKDIKYADIDKIIDCLNNNKVFELKNYMANSLEQSILNFSEEMQFFKKSIDNLFTDKQFYMSGSGSAFFAFIRPDEEIYVKTRIETFLDEVLVYSCTI